MVLPEIITQNMKLTLKVWTSFLLRSENSDLILRSDFFLGLLLRFKVYFVLILQTAIFHYLVSRSEFFFSNSLSWSKIEHILYYYFLVLALHVGRQFYTGAHPISCVGGGE